MQGLIYKHIERTFNFKYIDKLQDIIETYNNRKHRMTKLTPNQGEEKENSLHIQNMNEDYWRKIKPTKKIRFKVGDHVSDKVGDKVVNWYYCVIWESVNKLTHYLSLSLQLLQNNVRSRLMT